MCQNFLIQEISKTARLREQRYNVFEIGGRLSNLTPKRLTDAGWALFHEPLSTEEIKKKTSFDLTNYKNGDGIFYGGHICWCKGVNQELLVKVKNGISVWGRKSNN